MSKDSMYSRVSLMSKDSMYSRVSLMSKVSMYSRVSIMSKEPGAIAWSVAMSLKRHRDRSSRPAHLFVQIWS